MKLLEDKILKDGRILEHDILKVDSFLNHQIDTGLFVEMGKDIYNHFKDSKITKILTLEVSGIAVAFSAAMYFDVPVVFAKKINSLTLSDTVYSSKVVSYTKNKEYDIKVDKRFLNSEDRVLIIDDFLAKGQALGGLVDVCNQAGAEIAGVGIAIEKLFQGGGDEFRKKGYDVYSLAMIERFENGSLVFKNQE